MTGSIPESIISEIISANDITEIAAKYTELKRSGGSLVGLCPFHNEKTPSFHISPDMQLYYCFGCGAGGNVIGFVEAAENLDFVDAVKFLAERAGIAIPETGFAAEDRARHEKKQTLIKINTDAAKFFREQLLRGNNKKALMYAKQRGISDKMINVFGLGYAPDKWSAAAEHLLTLGYSKDDLVLSGVCGRSEGGRIYDRFRDRLMFPIIDVRGNIIGFGGRIFEGDGAKYLNSPETLIFNKRQNLFGLNLARKASPSNLILVEGYMDVLSLYQSGVQNAVASLGTAFTEEQARLISRYVKEAILCYDTDEAGVKAANRAIDVFRGSGVNIKILNLPDGKDPDEFVKKNGGESFKELAKKAKSVTEYKLYLLEKNYNLSDNTQKAEFASEAAKIIAASNSEVERDLYSKIIAEKTGISSHAIETQVHKNKGRYERREKSAVIRESISPKSLRTGVSKLLSSRRRLLSLFAFDRRLISEVPNVSALFDDDVHKRIFKSLSADGAADAALIMTQFSGDEVSEAAASLSQSVNYEDSRAAAREIAQTIKKEKVNALIEKAMKDGDLETLNRLIKEKNGL